MAAWLYIGIGGFLGAISRYGLATWVQGRFGGGNPASGAFPYGTLAVNLLGCLAAGALIAAIREAFAKSELPIDSILVQFCAIGFLGAFTTFSAFGVETLDLIRSERLGMAAASIGANVIGSIVCVSLGWWVTKSLLTNGT